MNNIISKIALVLSIIAVLVAVGGNSQSFGAAQRMPNTDFSAKTLTSNGAFTSTGDSTVNGGTLNVTTTNTATSTVIAGCWQTYATSTATPIKFQATTTAHAIAPVFGTCPNL